RGQAFDVAAIRVGDRELGRRERRLPALLLDSATAADRDQRHSTAVGRVDRVDGIVSDHLSPRTGEAERYREMSLRSVQRDCQLRTIRGKRGGRTKGSV